MGEARFEVGGAVSRRGQGGGRGEGMHMGHKLEVGGTERGRSPLSHALHQGAVTAAEQGSAGVSDPRWWAAALMR